MKQNKKRVLIALVAIVVVSITWYFYSNPNFTEYDIPSDTSVSDSIPDVAPEPILKYGLPVDSFEITTSLVKKNEFLSDILLKYGISYNMIDRLARESKPIFDVRKMKRGNSFSIFSSKDSLRQTDYFIYEIDNTDYVVYDFRDSLKITRGQKKIERVMKHRKGVITSSLWNAMVDNNINVQLSIPLSDIFAWTIDFFGIQKGDTFNVMYDELYVDGESIGIGHIYAADFTHRGEEYDAYRFEQDSTITYFDHEGKSLKKAFLKAPLKYSRISSRFSYSRLHPVLRYRRPHLGIDYAAPTGTPVHSIGDGVIIKKGYQRRGGGRYLKIKHNSVYTTTYMHLHGFAKGMSVGKRVKQGQLIGYVGSTGLATGPHLDFRVFRNGKAMDPLKLKAPPVAPVKPENRVRFESDVDSLKNLLIEPIVLSETLNVSSSNDTIKTEISTK
ncbi:peptidoglycan DD-metalloendopeptidase family protein [Halosquirtibacter laminarini]|uniref:Peptidoglycan DD-metalloendopeptidase family protein n=1 Tax=Halosquirtibacter laminarini TaxID=3374600 RepID=A0AC61NN14_9BACT|nr:peptidoglycan DD-metalloendopeptidase family protein [Prolixibacteraceae bacterium]